MGDTRIEWTEKTWNPIRARNKATGKAGWFCEHVSEGCRNCYAERMNRNTYFGNGLEYKPATLPEVELFLDEKILQQPLHWHNPQNVFPCSMTDLFGRWVKDEWLDQIFAVMALAKQHTFQVLTKRPERMLEYFNGKDSPLDQSRADIVMERAAWIGKIIWDARGGNPNLYMRATKESVANRRAFPGWPLPNVWLGVSCEDQKSFDERWPYLRDTPTWRRWLSLEPLLGPINISPALIENHYYCDVSVDPDDPTPTHRCSPLANWVVVGGESGPGARRFDLAWARSVVEQCRAAEAPVFMKQVGARPVYRVDSEMGRQLPAIELPITDKKGGDINEWPEDLRIREYPNGKI